MSPLARILAYSASEVFLIIPPPRGHDEVVVGLELRQA